MKRVLLLIPKGAEVFETAAFIDVLGWADAEGTTPIEVVTAGLSPQVLCTFGLKIVPDRLIDEVDPSTFDALAVPGGFEEHGYYEEAYSAAVGDLIGAFDDLERPIASICVGALPVAASGALDGRCATTYHLDGNRHRRQLAEFGVAIVDRPIVRDGHVITSTAPATAIEVALALLEDLTDRGNAERIRRLMGFGPTSDPEPPRTV
jgi:4-methyl-5(b-hydroxyethyl)-thiazole monophosphate biosynthesis